MDENPGLQKVENLLESVNNGSFVIPYFQRGFEWEANLVCDLIESILQGYYTGLILLWNLSKGQAINEKWDPLWGSKLKGIPETAILDGQQRLSALYYAIYNPEKIFPNRESYYLFYLNLTKVLNDDFDDAITYKFYFKYRSFKQLLKSEKDKWAETGIIPISILSAQDPCDSSQRYIDSKEFDIWLNEYLEKNSDILPKNMIILKAYQVFNKILKYSFVTYPLGSKRSIRDICNIFAMVNVKGLKLSTFDLMNAFLYPKGVKLRKDLWENLDNDLLKSIDKNMNEYLLKLISLSKQNYCSSKYLFNLIPGEKIIRKNEKGEKYTDTLVDDGREFKNYWKKSCNNAESARKMIMNVSDKDFGSIKQNFIPNSTIIPVLGAIIWGYGGDIDNIEFRKKISKWYWSAVFSEDYSGSSDSVMARDYINLKKWIKDNENNIDTIQKVNREYITGIDLKTTRRGSARYNAVISMIALNKAEDFYKGIVVGTGDFSDKNINDHHIFPAKVKGLESSKSRSFKNSKDSIVNRTLLFDETNMKIYNKKPSLYIKELRSKYGSEEKTKNIFKGHFINNNAFNYLQEDNFDDFIIEREKEIKKFIIKKIEE